MHPPQIITSPLDVYFHTSAVSNNPKSSNEVSCFFSSFAGFPPLTFPVPQSPNPPNDVPEDPAIESKPPRPEVPLEVEGPVKLVLGNAVGFPNAAELPVEELNPDNPPVAGGGGVAVLVHGFEYPPFPVVAVALIEVHGSENEVVWAGGGVALLVGIKLLNN